MQQSVREAMRVTWACRGWNWLQNRWTLVPVVDSSAERRAAVQAFDLRLVSHSR